jgi:hypothetical protein
MMRRLSTWLVVAATGGALVSGCGGGSGSTSSSHTSPTASTSTPTASTGGTTGAGGAKSPGALRTVAACKRRIGAQATLSASAKTRLDAVCERAVNGNPAALAKVAQEVCVEIVKSMHLPAGVAEERALAVCRVK